MKGLIEVLKKSLEVPMEEGKGESRGSLRRTRKWLGERV